MMPEINRCSIPKGDVYTCIYNATLSGAYAAYLRGSRCKTEDAFFHEISAVFQFPFYYGENWPATDECLCDLEWLHVSALYIVVDDFSLMFSRQPHVQEKLQTRVVKYFEIMAEYWKEQNVPIEVWLNN